VSTWQPAAEPETLRQFARLLASIRQHFSASDTLEVMTPVLSAAAVSDRHIESFSTQLASNQRPYYLQTSPEYPMKRLLAAGLGDCYQICPVFRQGEQGRFHNPEFTLLEWYRVGVDHHALMREVDALMHGVWPGQALPPTQTITFRDALESACGLDLDQLQITDIKALLRQRGHGVPQSLTNDLDAWLDLLFSIVVTASFPGDRFTLLTDYPESQAALARVINDDQGRPVAARFELYWGTLELANGYHELQDAQEQRRRFESDLHVRAQTGLPCRPLDEHLLEAMTHGLPDCAGVALGLERLMMVHSGLAHINDVLSFPIERA